VWWLLPTCQNGPQAQSGLASRSVPKAASHHLSIAVYFLTMLVTLIIYCDDIFYCYYLFIVYYYSAMVGLVFIVDGGCGRLDGWNGDFLVFGG